MPAEVALGALAKIATGAAVEAGPAVAAPALAEVAVAAPGATALAGGLEAAAATGPSSAALEGLAAGNVPLPGLEGAGVIPPVDIPAMPDAAGAAGLPPEAGMPPSAPGESPLKTPGETVPPPGSTLEPSDAPPGFKVDTVSIGGKEYAASDVSFATGPDGSTTPTPNPGAEPLAEASAPAAPGAEASTAPPTATGPEATATGTAPTTEASTDTTAGATPPEGAADATKTAEGEAKMSDDDRARLDALNGRDTGDLSAAELRERNDLKKKDEGEKTAERNEGARYDDVRKRLEAGEDVNDEDMKFATEFEDRRAEGTDDQSKEAADGSKELQDLGHDAITKLADAKDDESIKAAEDAMKKFKDKYNESTGKNASENFSDLVKKALSKERRTGDQREPREIQQMRERLGELIRLERDLMVVSQRLEALRKQYDETKKELKSMDGPSHRFDKDQQRRMERYKLMNHLITLQAEGKKTMLSKYEIKAQYAQTKAYLDRKLGVHGIVGLAADYAVAGYHQANLTMHENVDWTNADVGNMAA